MYELFSRMGVPFFVRNHRNGLFSICCGFRNINCSCYHVPCTLTTALAKYSRIYVFIEIDESVGVYECVCVCPSVCVPMGGCMCQYLHRQLSIVTELSIVAAGRKPFAVWYSTVQCMYLAGESTLLILLHRALSSICLHSMLQLVR